MRYMPSRPRHGARFLALMLVLGTVGFCAGISHTTSAAGPDVFRIAGDRDEAPYGYIDGDGTFTGIYVDTLNEAFSRLGVQHTHKPYEWAHAQDLVRRGAADAIITVLTPERAKALKANAVPLADLEWVAYVRSGHPRFDEIMAVGDIVGFRGLTLLDYAGNGWGKRNLAGLDVRREGTLTGTLLRLAHGQGDAFIHPRSVTEYSIERLAAERPDDAFSLMMLAPAPKPVDITHFHLLVRKDSPHIGLLPKLDAVLRQMEADGTWADIRARY